VKTGNSSPCLEKSARFFGFHDGECSNRGFWVVTPCTEDGGSKVLRNNGILQQHYTASQRRPRHELHFQFTSSHHVNQAMSFKCRVKF